MTIKTDPAARRCNIWVSYGEQAGYTQSPAYRQAVRQAHAKGYRVCVFVGGEAPLLPGVAALLDHQGLG